MTTDYFIQNVANCFDRFRYECPDVPDAYMPCSIDGTTARYIKLGPQGSWEKLCLEEGTLRFGYNELPHDVAESQDRDLIRNYFVNAGAGPGLASNKAREVLDFYDGDEQALWITFHAGMMWWCRAAAKVEALDLNGPSGARLRRVQGGWSNKSALGVPLAINSLSGHLTRTAAYRGTICRVINAYDYLLARLNDVTIPEVENAIAAQAALIDSICDVIRRLTWQDFELLVDLIFSSSGWRRTGSIGGTQKTVDIEMELPSTGEHAFVQVKSATTQAEFADYATQFAVRSEARMFYAYHSGQVAPAEAMNITLLGPRKVAEMAVNAGLTDWIIRKAC